MTPLPPGLALVLDPSVRVHEGGVLVGGAPRRALRLSAAGARALAALERGGADGDAAGALGRTLTDAGMAHPSPEPRPAAGDVTVVVPVRDRAAQLDRCLAALEPGTPVVVVDDGSRDGAAVAAVAARHGTRVVRRDAAGGPAAARNAALRSIDTELVAFLDSDCVPDPAWLRALVGHFDDPLVAAVAPRVRPLSAPRRGAVCGYLAARSPLDMGPRAARVAPGLPVSYVPTAALVVRRDALAGGFDEGLRYGEDVDLVWRLHERGRRVRYDPRVVVAHDEPVAVRRVLARRWRYGTSAAPLAARHPGRLAHAVLGPWPALAVALVLARRPGAAALVAAQHSVVLGERAHRLGLPRSLGPRWFARGAASAGLSMSRYVATFALPVAVAAALRRRRPLGLALLALPALEEWWRRRPDLGPVRWTALSLADDAAYGLGVWWGSARARTLAPLVPDVGAGRRNAGSSRRARAAPLASSRARRSRAPDPAACPLTCVKRMH
ncbi:MAG: mycofactocin glycosyltransferase [Solirubrobacteraceae bacterium]|nr:mycofactocin glycosyltransferase [Solirubrobacteraceae bacterium]